MKKKKDELVSRFAEEMQLPLSALTDTFRIELRGAGEMTVEGCMGIIEYDENSVSLNLGKNAVNVSGTYLEINAFSEQQAVITGNIASISFSVTGG